MTEPLSPLVGHTAGPWEALADRMLNGDWLIRTSHPEAESREIIEVCNASESDARLIAAAPCLLEVVRWYGEQARLARLIHSEGDAGRNALAADGGKRAQAAIANASPPYAASAPTQSQKEG